MTEDLHMQAADRVLEALGSAGDLSRLEEIEVLIAVLAAIATASCEYDCGNAKMAMAGSIAASFLEAMRDAHMETVQ